MFGVWRRKVTAFIVEDGGVGAAVWWGRWTDRRSRCAVSLLGGCFALWNKITRLLVLPMPRLGNLLGLKSGSFVVHLKQDTIDDGVCGFRKERSKKFKCTASNQINWYLCTEKNQLLVSEGISKYLKSLKRKIGGYKMHALVLFVALPR